MFFLLIFTGSILKRWKKEWFVLYQNGDLRYFENPNSLEPEARIFVPGVCKYITTGSMVIDVSHEVHCPSYPVYIQSWFRFGLAWLIDI